jgi:predicted RNA binding protein YcfA (HicA-like mRNA interferase family)
LVRLFEADGFVKSRTRGSHVAMTKAGVLRPIIIPMYDEVGPDIIKSNMKTAGMSRERYFELLQAIRH